MTCGIDTLIVDSHKTISSWLISALISENWVPLHTVGGTLLYAFTRGNNLGLPDSLCGKTKPHIFWG